MTKNRFQILIGYLRTAEIIKSTISVVIGVGLMLLIYRSDCLNYSEILSLLLTPIEAAVSGLSAFVVDVLRAIFLLVDSLFEIELPRPNSDAWEIVLSIAIFPQLRTLIVEAPLPNRFIATVLSFVISLFIAGPLSYFIGVWFPLSTSIAVCLAVSFVFLLLEFVRYTLHSFLRRSDEYSKGFYADFKRRNLEYTFPYFVISIVSSIVAFAVFGNSSVATSLFVTLLFLLMAFYLFWHETRNQWRRRRQGKPGVTFLQSTVTQSAIIFLSVVLGAALAVRIDQGSDLFQVLWRCAGFP